MKSLGLLVALLAACGGEHQHIFPDAVTADGMADAPVSDGCDYTEQRDATNDDVAPASGTPEATGLTLGSTTTICGTFDSTHFDGDITVDIDGYTVAVASDSDLLVRITGPGAEAIELVGVDIYGGAGLSTRVGANTFYGDHGVTALHLSPGTYELVPFALNSASITNDVPYRVWVETDSPATRCEELTTGGYSEGTGENDVIAFPSTGGPMLTAATTDSPEDIGVTLNATASTRIAGTATDIAMQDKYEDRDTFELRTQSATNEATLMLNWTGAADLDFFLFEPNNLDPIVRAVGTTAGNEVAMTSLKTTHTYWLVVAAKTGGTGLPASYSATLCGGHFY